MEGNPQRNTNTERSIHGIHALTRWREVAGGRFLPDPAASPSKRHVVRGCQKRRSTRSAPMEMRALAISTIQGPWKLLTRNWIRAKVAPATRQAGHTSNIARN